MLSVFLMTRKLSVLMTTEYSCFKICKNQLLVKSFCFVLFLVLSQSNTCIRCLETLVLNQGRLKETTVCLSPDLCQHVIMYPSRGGDQTQVLLGVLAHQSKSAHVFHLISLIIYTIQLHFYWYVNWCFKKFIILRLFSVTYLKQKFSMRYLH